MSNLITRNGKPNVIRGGIARQFAPGLFYMNGRTHAKGGIDIGKNPRTGVEVENGEVVQLNKNGMRVFSAMPFLTGESPASLVANGADPDIVFAAQENFKDRFGINDDGTMKAEYGLKVSTRGDDDNKYMTFKRMINTLGKLYYDAKVKAANKNNVDEETISYYPSLETVQYIKGKEAFRPNIYHDGKGIPTIGYGTTQSTKAGKNAFKLYGKTGMTEEQASSVFNETVREMLPNFISATPNFNRLNDNQRNALFSYYYNVGHGGYTRKSPKLQQALKDFNLDEVVNQMDFGYYDTKNSGLRKRRDEERALFNMKSMGGQTNKNIAVQIPKSQIKIIRKINSSKANFVDRLKNPNRKYIKDWESNKVATHKLGVGNDINDNVYIYPEVQEIDGKLIDFTRPPYHIFAGQDSAEQRGDTVRVDNIDDAIEFTQNYKKYYPNFEYKMGGIHIDKNKRGTFTAAATKHGMGVQEFASRVLANKEDYSPAMVKKANFAKNASRWKKPAGGNVPTWRNRVGIVTTRGFVPNSVSGYSGGQGGGGGATTPFYHIPQKYEEIVKDTTFIPYRETFNDAFARAKRQGLDNFVFDGKIYTTEMSDNPNWKKAGDSRAIEGVIPIITERKKINYKKAGGVISINGNVKNGLVYTDRAKAPMGTERPVKRLIRQDGQIYAVIDTNRGEALRPATDYELQNYVIDEQLPEIDVVEGDYNAGSLPQVDVVAPKRYVGPKDWGRFYTFNNPNINISTPRLSLKGGIRNTENLTEGDDTLYAGTLPEVVVTPQRNNTSIRTSTNRQSQPVADTPVWDDIFNETVIGERPAVSPRTGRLSDNYKLTIPDRIIRGGEITPPEYRADITNSYIDGNFDGEVSKDRQPETDTTGGGFNLKDPSIIAAGVNMLGSLGSYLINRNMLNKSRPKPTSVKLTAQKLKTRYNINPQLDELREQAAANNRLISNNTASSRTALGRMNLINTALGRSRAELYGNKENRETELINQDILNSQNVGNQQAIYNAQLRADYQNRLDDFNRLKLANNSALFSGLTGGVNSIVDALLRQRYYNNTIGAIGARNPNVDARIFRDAGVDWSFMYPYSTRNRS